MTLPAIDYLATAPRYTTLAAVKKFFNIDNLDTEWDTEITDAIVAVELAIDKHLGAPFPRPDWEPAIPGVPKDIAQAAQRAASKLFTAQNAPFGTAGSEEYLGEIEVMGAADVVAQEVRRNPLLLDYRTSFGMGG